MSDNTNAIHTAKLTVDEIIEAQPVVLELVPHNDLNAALHEIRKRLSAKCNNSTARRLEEQYCYITREIELRMGVDAR